ncbi:unnamed protein product [Agarophyton chilense]|eukprot:gb/GEZJ01000252.1/.p1 GENE.gb/GEZJ01000252.1/~~gb/GEZJ01000252.1/.p1  ORF type:complete len:384 (-),score=38.05 gb/GEZJ01000252.1/:1479-2630(-)
MKPQGVLVSDWTQPSRILVGWPQRQDTWRQKGIPARDAIVNFIHAILSSTESIHVSIIVGERNQSKYIHDLYDKKWPDTCLVEGERLSVDHVPMNDCWIRDTGPFFITDHNATNSCPEGVCFRFNAWGGSNGGCYVEYDKDAEVGIRLCARFDIKAHHVNMVLEGGSVSSDGQGTVIVTKECLLNPNRNPEMTQDDIERTLQTNFGVSKVIWLPLGAAFDTDVDGHVDNMAMFIRPGHVLLLWADQDICPDQFQRSSLALKALHSNTDANGNPLVVHKITAPPVLIRSRIEADGVESVTPLVAKPRREGEQLCASYVNVVITNEAVFVPAFGDVDTDDRAQRELREAFAETGQKIVMINAREIVLGGGGLHCMTLAIPEKGFR